MDPVDLRPIPPGRRTQPPFDLFLIFAGANIVATTLQTGASLAAGLDLPVSLALIAAGTLSGSALIAVLATVGPALGVPSMIASRAALGYRGAGLLAALLVVTNFAWIAVNNVIAASACAAVWGGPGSARAWAAALGLLSTVVVAGGPRLVARADRVAVPLLVFVGIVLTAAAWRSTSGGAVSPPSPVGAMAWTRGFDVVAGYQVSWILMFADYSRYTPSRRQAGAAVFLGLALTSLWLMPVGLVAARAAGSSDPGVMLRALGLGASGAVLLAIATLTTNFVNIYMSSLAIRSLAPRTGGQAAVWTTGLIGGALGLYSGDWLDRYASFMVVLGGLMVPVGGVLAARFFLVRERVAAAALYDRGHGASHGFDLAGLAGWMAGGATYYAAAGIGGTLPSLLAAVIVYLAVRRLRPARR
jgi:NCS1 family nucleobase:cation symporter-1